MKKLNLRKHSLIVFGSYKTKLNPTLRRIQISVQFTALILDSIYHTQPLQTSIVLVQGYPRERPNMRSATKVTFKDASTTSSPLPAPSTVAKKALSNGLHALHETLRDHKAFTGVAMKFLQLLITLRAKEKPFDKFNDASYLPQSVRFKVDLKASKSVTLKERMEAEVKAFQVSMSDYMKESSLLEISALRRKALERTAKFADLMVKQKLLANGACRVHSQSSELTVKVFDDVEIEGGEGIPELRFGHDDNEVCHVLGLDPVPHSQPEPILDKETEMVMEVQQALKNTISRALLEYDNREKENRLSQKTKEIILQEIA